MYFSLNAYARAQMISMLPPKIAAQVDESLFDEVDEALVRLDMIEPWERIAHAFEAQRLEISDATAQAIAKAIMFHDLDVFAARMEQRALLDSTNREMPLALAA